MLLSLAIWIPMVAGVLVLVLGERYARWTALVGSMLGFVVTLPLYWGFDASSSAMQFVEFGHWIERFNVNYHLGVDGISVLFVLLNSFITVLAVTASWSQVDNRVAQYYAAFLILSGMLNGVFEALDAVLFYVFFEGTLVPMFIIIGVWGGPNRVYASVKFFLYTLMGSLLMLVALLYLYGKSGGSFAILDWHKLPLPLGAQLLLFFGFLFAFAVKVPMWPVHTWLPDAHTEAPTAGSVVLAAILLKLGAYGFLRFSLPIMPDASRHLAWLMIALSVIAVVYIGFVALAQTDMKRLIAYSSISHMGLVTLGFFIFNAYGVEGGLVQMISHGFVSAALFLCVGVLYDRMHSRMIADYGGVVNTMPKFAGLMMLFAMANSGLPATSGFVGEFLVLLLAGACALMIVDLYVKSERRNASFGLAQIVLLLCALASLYVFLVQGQANYSRLLLFNGLFVSDTLSNLLKLLSCLAVWATLIYSRQYLVDRGLLRGEFLTLLLFSLLGMMVMISANSFLTMYLGLELMSLCLYAMVALDRDSAISTEAAMKYFILGALSSGLLLYGMSMIYGATGTLNISEVAQRVSQIADTTDRSLLVFGLVFMVAGIAFKLGAAPFHMWIPDVYQGAPTAITLVIGSAPKLAAFAMAVRLLVNGLLDLAQDWQQMLALLALLSMAIGNITAIAQSNIKRMLAYSTIAHMGFMLLGLLSGVVGGNLLNAADAYSTALFYVVVYVLMTLGSFGMLLYLSRKGFECENLDDFRGLNRRSPWFAFVMMVLMFSLAGLPPTAGFYAKLAVLSSAVQAGQLWLAVAAVILSLVGAFYYLRIVKLMYFDEPKETGPVPGHREMRLLLSVNALVLLVLGILPQGLMQLCYIAINTL